jgi:EAL domain-containing protein (putative c-di-GMP-specific phosphodiesterase class I)
VRLASNSTSGSETPFLTLTVSVNLSRRDLSQPDLSEYVENTLKETGLDPKDLSLEITRNVHR